jgi:hypothetical protein
VKTAAKNAKVQVGVMFFIIVKKVAAMVREPAQLVQHVSLHHWLD